MKREHLETNRSAWNERAQVHVKTPFYDLDRFVAGTKTGLHETEPGEMGDVQGKRLVQLQCHLGLETLAWARLGASHVVGLDFAPDAIATARELAVRTGLADRAEFVLSDVHDAPAALADKAPFDVVYVSVGAISWLPSIERWARICAGLLEPGGVLYMREVHPMLSAVDRREDGTLAVTYPYFEHETPLRWSDPSDYADPDARLTNEVSYEWHRGLGQIVQALIDAGFVIELLHEHRDAEWLAFPHMIHDPQNGTYRLPSDQAEKLPLMFSLRARKSR